MSICRLRHQRASNHPVFGRASLVRLIDCSPIGDKMRAEENKPTARQTNTGRSFIYATREAAFHLSGQARVLSQ
jgi:hypothetical protein